MDVTISTCYQIVPEINKLGDEIVGVEVGVWKGENIEALLQCCPNIKKMYGIDPYKAYGNYLLYRDEAFLAPLRIEAIERIAKLGDKAELIELPSAEAVNRFEEESVDFVFIDANHSFAAVYEDLHIWYKRLKPGGIFSGHDFDKHGVNDALFKFRKDLKMKSTFAVTGNQVWWWEKPTSITIRDI
jgi:SAM-dependent methyltransferase